MVALQNGGVSIRMISMADISARTFGTRPAARLLMKNSSTHKLQVHTEIAMKMYAPKNSFISWTEECVTGDGCWW